MSDNDGATGCLLWALAIFFFVGFVVCFTLSMFGFMKLFDSGVPVPEGTLMLAGPCALVSLFLGVVCAVGAKK